MTFFHPKTFGNDWRNFWLSQLGRVKVKVVTGIKWVEARDTAKRPTVARTDPHSEELFGQKCEEYHG